MNKLGTTCAMLAAALLISACNPGVHSVQEKIAVVNWEQAVSAHPDYNRLQQGEKILADLVSKRKAQENLAKAQLSSLNKLRGLRQLSQQSFLTADFNTQMVNLRERENMNPLPDGQGKTVFINGNMLPVEEAAKKKGANKK